MLGGVFVEWWISSSLRRRVCGMLHSGLCLEVCLEWWIAACLRRLVCGMVDSGLFKEACLWNVS